MSNAPDPLRAHSRLKQIGVHLQSGQRSHELQLLPLKAPSAAASGQRGWNMSDEELYLFDTMGFLRVRNVLDKATVADALQHSMHGIASGAFEDLRRSPPGQNPGGDFYDNAFLRDKVIERVARQPAMMDYVCHTLNNQPRLSEQILVVQNHKHKLNNFHLRKDNDVQIREDAPRFYTDPVNRRIYADHVSFFVYLTDVKEGDGGLCVAPGAHRSTFKYPKTMFYDGTKEPRTEKERKKLGFVTVTANAGDVIIMPLRLLHAVMPWQPTDRDRVVLFYTYIPQFYYSEKPPTTITSDVMRSPEAQHLDPETVDLVSCRDKGEMKAIVKTHLDTSMEDSPPVPTFNPADL